MKRILFLLLILPALAYGQVGTASVYTAATPTVDATPYTANDCLGGLVRFDFPKSNSFDRGYVTSLQILNTSSSPSSIEGTLYLFESEPTGGTLTNNSACRIATTDASKLIGKIAVASTSYTVATATGVNFVDTSVVPLNQIYSSSANTGSIWGVFVVSNTPTLSGASTIRFRLGLTLY